MPWNHLSLGRPLQMLQSLGAVEPSWMISRQPTLGNAITPLHMSAGSVDNVTPTYIFDNVAMIADEEECARIGHIDLHSNQAWGAVSRIHGADQEPYHRCVPASDAG
jgi:hypothetical protein